MKYTDVKKANLPKSDTNPYLAGEAQCHFEGVIDKTMTFVEEKQLLNMELWKRFVKQFQIQADSDDRGWRGEYWGKMMRGACLVYGYSQNEELYQILTQTVKEILECCDAAGRITTYSKENELKGWDIWGRKYVLLGMQYYLEICEDEKLTEEIVKSMCCQVDYLISKIGNGNGKIRIVDATDFWRGLNSSSLLEPVVRLYNITQDDRYLEFARYIVDEGGLSIANIFRMAYENKFYPYQYPMTKAYETISCFEGLLEFYRVTKEEWQKKALIQFADRVLESDFTIIGSSGCTHELFDHSTVRQANTNNGSIMQETCVTVTLMKFMYQMTLLTGDAKYVDAFEQSLYNAYLGAVNTESAIEPTIRDIYPDAVIEPLPFDSYSPLTAGTRGNGIGGFQLMKDQHYYGCCACIGSAGIGLVPKMALMRTTEGIVVNLYIQGRMVTESPNGEEVCIDVDTTYPKTGNVLIKIRTEDRKPFAIVLRNPAWSSCTEVEVNREKIVSGKGYIVLERIWNDEEINICFDMRTKAIQPIAYGQQILMNDMVGEYDYVRPFYDEEDPIAKNHIALRRGPIILAVDNRLGCDAGDVYDILISEDGYVETTSPKTDTAPYEHIIELEVPLKSHDSFRVTDYASAGKLWTNESKMTAWILTDTCQNAKR